MVNLGVAVGVPFNVCAEMGIPQSLRTRGTPRETTGLRGDGLADLLLGSTGSTGVHFDASGLIQH